MPELAFGLYSWLSHLLSSEVVPAPGVIVSPSVARTTKTVRTGREDVAQAARVITLASVSVEISMAPGLNPVPEMVTVLPTNGATRMKARVLTGSVETEIPPAHRVPFAINIRIVSPTVVVMVATARR